MRGWTTTDIVTDSSWPCPGVKLSIKTKLHGRHNSFATAENLAKACDVTTDMFPKQFISPPPVTFRADARLKHIVYVTNFRHCFKTVLDDADMVRLPMMLKQVKDAIPDKEDDGEEEEEDDEEVVQVPKKRERQGEESDQIPLLLQNMERRLEQRIMFCMSQDARLMARQQFLNTPAYADMQKQVEKEYMEKMDAEVGSALKKARDDIVAEQTPIIRAQVIEELRAQFRATLAPDVERQVTMQRLREDLNHVRAELPMSLENVRDRLAALNARAMNNNHAE